MGAGGVQSREPGTCTPQPLSYVAVVQVVAAGVLFGVQGQAAGSAALQLPPEIDPYVVSVKQIFVFEQAQPSMVGNEAQVEGGGKSQ